MPTEINWDGPHVMAGDWIKMRTDLYRDPKVCLIADILMNKDGALAGYVNQYCQRDMTVTRNVTRCATVGALVAVWGVMRTRGRRIGDDLLSPGASLSVLDDVADLAGFGDAMASVGWAVETAQGVVFPGFFGEFNVDPADEAKAKSAERQRRYRENQSHKSDVTVTSRVAQQSNAREEKRREELNTKREGGDEPLYCDFVGCNEAFLTILDPDAGTAATLNYRDDPLRWQWLWITWWNTLPRVSHYSHHRLDSHCERELVQRLQERDWDWPTSKLYFPLNFPDPALPWFLSKGIVQQINANRFKIRDTKGKSAGKRKGPNNHGSTYNPNEVYPDVVL